MSPRRWARDPAWVRTNLDWPPILEQAAAIVNSYSTGVTLRQLFYRLVSAQVLPNTTNAYGVLSRRTATARREGGFPALLDRRGGLHRASCWDSPADAVRSLVGQYRLDRTEGQDVSIYLGVEKAGLVVQMESWFGGRGIPILALGGYASQTLADAVVADVEAQGREAVLFYAGDFDPTGEDIDRDFVERTDCWDEVVRVALSAAQVEEYDLPEAMGKAGDSRAAGFIARNGALVQVEVDAIPPDVLRSLFETAIGPLFDKSTFDAVRERERADVERLRGAGKWLDGAA